MEMQRLSAQIETLEIRNEEQSMLIESIQQGIHQCCIAIIHQCYITVII